MKYFPAIFAILFFSPLLWALDVLADIVPDSGNQIRSMSIGESGVCWLESTKDKQRQNNNILGVDSVILVKSVVFVDGKAIFQEVWKHSGLGIYVFSTQSGMYALSFVYWADAKKKPVFIREMGKKWQVSDAQEISPCLQMPLSQKNTDVLLPLRPNLEPFQLDEKNLKFDFFSSSPSSAELSPLRIDEDEFRSPSDFFLGNGSLLP